MNQDIKCAPHVDRDHHQDEAMEALNEKREFQMENSGPWFWPIGLHE